MKCQWTLFFLILFSISGFSQKEVGSITIGKRYSIESKILNQTRNYTVFLPPSYGTTEVFRYPVIYMIDGEYNFRHLSGLVEQLSSVSEKIPEMIVVGISDAGQPDYVKNSTPYDKKKNPDGQSENFLKFITEELRPVLSAQFPVSDYDLLMGHSLGGLFTVNAFLSAPKSFNGYVAISPSLWWKDYEAEKQVSDFFDKHENLNRFLFLSVGDENGMGVAGFYNQFDVKTFEESYLKKTPLGVDCTFEHFPEENHGSVGLITMDRALKKLFRGYYLSAQKLQELKTFEEYAEQMEPFAAMVGKGFRLPVRNLTSVVGTLCESEAEAASAEEIVKEQFPASLADFRVALSKSRTKAGKHEDALRLLEAVCRTHPQSPEYLQALAEAHEKKKDMEKAKEFYQKAFDLAKANGARQWYQNHLMGHVLKI